jgi:hypothetical protein
MSEDVKANYAKMMLMAFCGFDLCRLLLLMCFATGKISELSECQRFNVKI